ncbi:MAG: tetratricopeptide repeat protein [Rhodoblastus sp.]|uniref:tetratricopeptide repeat protein n=1 Tax=Rhodoblastus sp. TaxID=1962975 RepID=UPI003F944731
MKAAVWLLASSLGASVAAGAALAEDKVQVPMDFFPPVGNARVIPTQKAKQSPAATACANEREAFSPEARLDGCSALIASGRWKGREIAWAYVNRCIIYKAQGLTEKALANCDQAVEQDPQSWFAYQMRGEVFEKLGNPEKALADYDKATEAGGKNVAIFANRGDLLLTKGEYDKAIADYNRAIEINDQSVLAYIGRGGAWVAKGDADSALADFDKVIEIAPDNAIAWYDRGTTYFAKGDNGKAAENLKQALTLNPKNAYAALWRFIALASDGADAKGELQAGAAKISQTAWPWPVVEFFLGAKDATQTLAAASSSDEKCEAQFYVGQERLLKKATDEATPFLRRAIEICPRNFTEYFVAAAEMKKLEPAVAAPKPESEPQTDSAPQSEAAPHADVAPKADAAPKTDAVGDGALRPGQ